MFQYDFMQHAFAAGTVVAVMCGAIGVFVIARSLSFIAHSFSHIGFSGAAFAVCIGWNPLSGLLLFSTISALAIGGFGVKMFRRDVTISIILSFFLGLGLFFIALTAKQATAMYALLFGSVVGINYYTNAPVTFFIATLECIFYFLALGWQALKQRRKPLGREAGAPVWQQA